MKNHQEGFTLIELMISLVLGLSLIAGISELFLQSQKTYRAQRSLSYMMEDGRYVLEVLSKELRHTGFLRNRNASNGLPNKIFLPDTAALGTSIAPDSAPTIDLNQREAIHGESGEASDVFVFRYQLNDKNDLSATDPSNSTSPCTRNIDLEAGEDPATEAHVVTTYFFVDNEGVLKCEAKRETIDFANKLIVCIKPDNCAKPSEEDIISNVERLIVKYGVDFDIDTNPNVVDDFGVSTIPNIPNPRIGLPRVKLDLATDPSGNTVLLDAEGNPVPILDGSANYYVDANNVSDWKRVVAAKIYVVMRSEDDELTQGNSTYSVEGTTYTATDKRYYRVFSTTIAFRNQV